MDALSPRLRRLVSLSYPVGGGLYGKGNDDMYFVGASAVAWTVLRHVLMVYVLSPLAAAVIPVETISKSASRTPALLRHEQRLVAKRRQHNISRFAEQAWGMLYCTAFWSIGMTILHRIPNALSAEQVWGTYPCTPIPWLTKWYYLAQLGWWFHQVYAINTEKRRKDYWQMFGHHFITIALIGGSYAASYTRVGVIVHVLMDTCDIFLPLAKILRYMNLRKACDVAFVAFLVAWVITRQVGLFMVIKSVYAEAPKYIPLEWDPENGIYFSPPIYWSFIILLSLLFVMCTIWFHMAIMVALRVVTGKQLEDVRSDSEEEDEISVDGDESDASSVAGGRGRSNSAATNGKANGNGNGNGNGYANGRVSASASGRATPSAIGNGAASNGFANGDAYTNGFANGYANGHSPCSSLGSNASGLKQRK